jgi:hypothetical protein
MFHVPGFISRQPGDWTGAARIGHSLASRFGAAVPQPLDRSLGTTTGRNDDGCYFGQRMLQLSQYPNWKRCRASRESCYGMPTMSSMLEQRYDVLHGRGRDDVHLEMQKQGRCIWSDATSDRAAAMHPAYKTAACPSLGTLEHFLCHRPPSRGRVSLCSSISRPRRPQTSRGHAVQ